MVDDILSKTGLYQNGIKMFATTMCFGHPQKRDHFFAFSWAATSHTVCALFSSSPVPAM